MEVGKKPKPKLLFKNLQNATKPKPTKVELKQEKDFFIYITYKFMQQTNIWQNIEFMILGLVGTN